MGIYQVYPKKKKGVFDFFKNMSLTAKLISINVICFVVLWPLLLFNVISIEFIALNPKNIFDLRYIWTFFTSIVCTFSLCFS